MNRSNSDYTVLLNLVGCYSATADRRARTGRDAQGRRFCLAHLGRIPPSRVHGARTSVRVTILAMPLHLGWLRKGSSAKKHTPTATSSRRTLSRTRLKTRSTGTRSTRNTVCGARGHELRSGSALLTCSTHLLGFFMHLDKLLAWLEDGTLRQVR